jgi:biopolymer transport protein ExbB
MKNLNKYLLSFALIGTISVFAQDVIEGEATTTQALLQMVLEGRTSEQTANSKREADFGATKNKQAAKLAAEKRELARQEKIADTLEKEYKSNESILVVKETAYKKELGSLVELFGHLQSSAGEASALFADSLSSGQYGRDRETFLNNLSSKMSSATELPTIRELEGLWYELQREMVAGSEVVTFNADVITLDGESVECAVTRVGLYNVICDGKYLEYIGSKGQYAFLGKQPEGRYVSTAKKII